MKVIVRTSAIIVRQSATDVDCNKTIDNQFRSIHGYSTSLGTVLGLIYSCSSEVTHVRPIEIGLSADTR